MTLVFALALAGTFWANRRDGDGGRVGPPPGQPGSEIVGGSVGTSGTGNDLPPAIIQEFETVSGAVDGNELIGRRVDLHAVVHDVANDVAFWAGEGDNRVLVVSSRHNITAGEDGQATRIQGTIQRLPKAEEMDSWRLTRDDVAKVGDRQIYIRADSVMPIAN